MMNSSYVLTLGNLYNTKQMNMTGIQSDKVDLLIKAVLREMYNSAE
ncbi:MAG TPA: hypothetical protein PKW98_10105 [Candidatus Wallbacteria bacterium]|nr:MAG: hypothetical protein BWY32_03527 [bacterium ADurb.Bin243]HOD39229.1 hypothetical protein [Candidatus Wallbacteria bacterium]HPG58156.1 hypothetical protein [Candidatus Wallbacteria bacterium]